MRVKSLYFDINSPESMEELEGQELYDVYDPEGIEEIKAVARYQEHDDELPF